MWVAYVDHVGWQGRDRQGGQKLLIPTTGESQNVNDRQGGHKVLIPAVDMTITVGGEGGLFWMAR